MPRRRLHVNSDLVIPIEQVTVRASRSSGPGGQHANVTNSRIEASIDIATCDALSAAQRERLCRRLGPRATAVAQEGRSQARNRDLALDRLARVLADALYVPKRRRPTRPTRGSRRRRVEAKRRQGERKRQRRKPGPDG